MLDGTHRGSKVAALGKMNPPDTTENTTSEAEAPPDAPRVSGKLTPPRGYDAADMDRRVSWLAEQTGHQLDEFTLENGCTKFIQRNLIKEQQLISNKIS